MIEITIEMCCWCGPMHPVKVLGAGSLAPGATTALVKLSHGMCKAAEAKWMETMNPTGVSHPVTPSVSKREGTEK